MSAHLEPPGSAIGPCQHGERGDLSPYRVGAKVRVVLDAEVEQPPRPSDGKILLVTEDGTYLLAERWAVSPRGTRS